MNILKDIKYNRPTDVFVVTYYQAFLKLGGVNKKYLKSFFESSELSNQIPVKEQKKIEASLKQYFGEDIEEAAYKRIFDVHGYKEANFYTVLTTYVALMWLERTTSDVNKEDISSLFDLLIEYILVDNNFENTLLGFYEEYFIYLKHLKSVLPIHKRNYKIVKKLLKKQKSIIERYPDFEEIAPKQLNKTPYELLYPFVKLPKEQEQLLAFGTRYRSYGGEDPRLQPFYYSEYSESYEEALEEDWDIKDKDRAQHLIKRLSEGDMHWLHFQSTDVPDYFATTEDKSNLFLETINRKRLACGQSVIKKEDVSNTLAWDLDRGVSITMMSFSAGILTEAEMYANLQLFVKKTCQYFKTWDDYYLSYYFGAYLYGQEYFEEDINEGYAEYYVAGFENECILLDYPISYFRETFNYKLVNFYPDEKYIKESIRMYEEKLKKLTGQKLSDFGEVTKLEVTFSTTEEFEVCWKEYVIEAEAMGVPEEEILNKQVMIYLCYDRNEEELLGTNEIGLLDIVASNLSESDGRFLLIATMGIEFDAIAVDVSDDKLPVYYFSLDKDNCLTPLCDSFADFKSFPYSI